MKILYLKLENFVNIFAGMKKKTIEIDFSKTKNNLVVLTGPNGSGKTSILSELHPFANSGNMDVRNDACLIMDGRDGFKEIHIQDEDDVYVIKHNYLYKNKTKAVKSFISKNGVELNANGNVKSFKETVLDHLGLDQDLLKLMRLGSNVTSLVDMKSTNRKSFATKLFSDIDIYGGFFKKVSSECRNTRALLKNIGEKIAKYNISDESEFEKQIQIVNDEILEYENRKDALIKDIATIEAKLSDINISDEESVRTRYKVLENEVSEAESLLSLIQNIHVSKAEYELMQEKEKSTMTNKATEIKASINMKIFERDTLYNKRQELDEKLKSAVSNVRLKDLQTSIDKYNDEIKHLEESLKGREIYDREGLLKFKEHVDKTNSMVSDLGHYAIHDIKKIASSILDNVNIRQFIETNRSKLSKEYETIHAEIINIENISANLKDYIIPENACKSDCPYKEFYYKIVGKVDNLEDLIEERNKINKILTANEELYNLHDLICMIRDFADEFEYDGKLPMEISGIKVLECMTENKAIINMNLLNLSIDDAESFERIVSLKKDIESFDKEYKMIKEYSIDVIEVENQILDIDKKVNVINDEIQELETEQSVCESVIRDIERESAEIIRALVLKESLVDIESELKDKKYRLDEIDKLKEKQISYYSDSSRLKAELNRTTDFLNSLVTRKEQLSFSLKDFRNLSTEHEAISLLFKEADEIREALNSSTGIPLVYLKVYLKNCPAMMNNLLQNVSGGKLSIDDFKIDDNEFRIPFRNDGLSVPDIIMSSQGERSFISIVLSLSLIIQSMTKYNIICLDELDGPLDTSNREEFIKVLYSFIKMVGCDQVFLITHNNMFDNEPVDIIQTGEVDSENFKYGNTIFKA